MHSAVLHRPDTAPAARHRIAFVGAIALLETAHLLWEHTHGGIARHHLLNDPGLPAVWNGWGLLLLPVLAWVAAPRLLPGPAASWRMRGPAIARLLAAAIAGLVLAVAFATGRESVASTVFLGVVLSAPLARVYRIECLLGFVLGLAPVLGAGLPAVIGGCIAAVSAALWFGPWRVIGRLAARRRRR